MMHLEITQGGGISSVFPPAIASILPVMGIQEVYAKSISVNNIREWVVEGLKYTYGSGTYVYHPFGASLQRYTDSGYVYLGMAPLYVVDNSNFESIHVKFLTDIPDYEIDYVKTYISTNPHIHISRLVKLSSDNTTYSVNGMPLYMYDQTTLEDVPFTIVGMDEYTTGSVNSSYYTTYVQCEYSNVGNVIVAASHIFEYN